MTGKNSSWPRVVAVLVLLAGTALFLHSRSQAEILPPRQPLASFPTEVANWQGKVGKWQGAIVQIPDWALEVLGNGEFAERSFSRSPEEPPVDLFMAYFATQRMGSTMHSPQNCLPGSGWTPVESSRVTLTVPSRATMTLNRYIVARGDSRLLVYYWYQEHGRVVASEYWSKFYLVADSIRFNRSDGALVRVSTPISPRESITDAEQRSRAFIGDVVPLLGNYIPK